MKKLIYLLPVLALFFTACDPMDDIYATIDAQDNGIVGDAEYTLTDDDYETLGLDYGTFNSEEDVKASAIIPNILSENFPVWGKNSSVLVNYQLYLGTAEGVNDYRYADDYALSVSDYTLSGSDALGFYPDVTPSDFLGNILAANISAPEVGEIVLVKYDQYIENPTVGYTDITEYTYDFNGAVDSDDFDGFEAISVVGDEVWNKGKSTYIRMSGYVWPDNVPNEDWLISPEIDLTEKSNLRFQMKQYLRYYADVAHPELITIAVSENYTTGGDHTAADWAPLDIVGMPAGFDSDYHLTEDYDFTAYEGKNIHIAFKYESTSEVAPNWRIDFAKIKEIGITGDANSHEDYYVYTGDGIDEGWVQSEMAYFVQDLDFASMGIDDVITNHPNTFGSVLSQDNYLPTFLDLKYPFAQEGDELIVIYDYYSSSNGGSAQVRGNLYSVIDGVWVGYESEISASYQYGHDGIAWIPDNTIKYELGDLDYDYIAAQLDGNSYFDNVSLTNFANYNDYDYNWKDGQILYSLDLFLDYLDPTAEEGQKYTVTYLLYDNGTNNVDRYLIKEAGEWVWNE